MMFGQGVGAFVFTGLSDRYGRKPMHVICHLVLFGIALGTAFVPSYAGFAVMRVLTGAFQQVRRQGKTTNAGFAVMGVLTGAFQQVHRQGKCVSGNGLPNLV